MSIQQLSCPTAEASGISAALAAEIAGGVVAALVVVVTILAIVIVILVLLNKRKKIKAPNEPGLTKYRFVILYPSPY